VPKANICAGERLLHGAALEAIAAIDRFAAVGLKRHLGLNPTRGANGIVQLTWGTIVAAASATVARPTATTGLFGRITTGLTFLGFLKPFAFKERLFVGGKGKFPSAALADNLAIK